MSAQEKAEQLSRFNGDQSLQSSTEAKSHLHVVKDQVPEDQKSDLFAGFASAGEKVWMLQITLEVGAA